MTIDEFRKLKKTTERKNYVDKVAAFLLNNGYRVIMEYRFDDKRRWRADLAIIEHRLLLEIDGGLYKRKFVKCRCGNVIKAGFAPSGHSHPTGIKQDQEKQNAAIVQGWKVLRYTTDLLNTQAGYLQILSDVERCVNAS